VGTYAEDWVESAGLILLKTPHLLRCIRAESLKLKAERG
jgi:hypothetical protein